jgi:hypothetical protein
MVNGRPGPLLAEALLDACQRLTRHKLQRDDRLRFAVEPPLKAGERFD